MHSQYIGAQMHLLDPNANDELTRMTHDPKCSDAGYLFGERFVRSRRLCLNRNRYHRSFSERYLIPSERRLATTLTGAYKKKELTNISFVASATDTALVICAYASMDNLNVQRVHSLFKQSAQEALPDSASFLELQGFVHISPEIDAMKRAHHRSDQTLAQQRYRVQLRHHD